MHLGTEMTSDAVMYAIPEEAVEEYGGEQEQEVAIIMSVDEQGQLHEEPMEEELHDVQLAEEQLVAEEEVGEKEEEEEELQQ